MLRGVKGAELVVEAGGGGLMLRFGFGLFMAEGEGNFSVMMCVVDD